MNTELHAIPVETDQEDVALLFRQYDLASAPVVDSSGRVIWPDRLMMLFAMDILNRNEGAEIIYDVKCSRHLARVISDFGSCG